MARMLRLQERLVTPLAETFTSHGAAECAHRHRPLGLAAPDGPRRGRRDADGGGRPCVLTGSASWSRGAARARGTTPASRSRPWPSSCGFTSTTCTAIESGAQPPSVAYVAGLAELTDVTCDYLLGRSAVSRPWDAVPENAVPAALLRDAILLAHPDRHPPVRQDQATRVTQELNALLDRRG